MELRGRLQTWARGHRRGATGSSAQPADMVPLRLLTVYGLGAMMVAVPVKAIVVDMRAELATGSALAAVVAGDDLGFLLDRDGNVVRIAADGSAGRTAVVGPYRTPFGTAVGGHVVFGGIRCTGSGCDTRLAELTILDGDGRRPTTLVLERTSGWPSRLDGLALVGRDGDTLWLNGGGTLFQVSVPPAMTAAAAAQVAEVPWPGGEPCVIDGVLHDLGASGGSRGRQGTGSTVNERFRLRLSAWAGDAWLPVPGADASMAYGQNAYCAPGGYEIRDGGATLAHWEPGAPRRTIGPVDVAAVGDLASLTSSIHRRYAVEADGTLVRVAAGGAPQPTGVTIAGFTSSEMPPAVQVDDAGGSLTWCATTYGSARSVTRCGVAPGGLGPGDEADAPDRATGTGAVGAGAVRATGTVETTGVHHYNLCSSSCGSGVRPHSRDVVAWFVGRHRPAAVSLNEQCYDDAVHLADRLPDYTTGAGYVALETTTNCPGAVKQFGNQVLVQRSLSPRSASWAQFPTQADLPCDNRTQECRGMACAEGRTAEPEGGARTVYCTAHLESPRHGESLPAIQAAEYVDLVSQRYGRSAVRFLAGDFNMERQHADVPLGRAGFRSGTVGPTVSGHRPPAAEQIDMIYDDLGEVAPDGTTYCDLQASDHCYVART